MKEVLLYFGSFNPVHKGHIALCEYMIESGRCEEVVMVVSPQNPLKSPYTLAPELMRFEMAEIAARNSKYPEQIKPSIIEFMLERPSYTIDTLRHLSENYGDQMHFSILMGSDNIENFDKWKEYEHILNNYKIYVYPRNGYSAEKFISQVELLEDAPTIDICSTEIREAIQRGQRLENLVDVEVAKFIRGKGLWTIDNLIGTLNLHLEDTTDDPQLYIERGKLHYQKSDWGAAINDFRKALNIDPENQLASQFIEMIEEILAFRYTDIYNP